MDISPREDRAWAAGFFDGEGSVSLAKNRWLRINIGQADPEPLERFRAAVGLGRVLGPYQHVPTRGGYLPKPHWMWATNQYDEIETIAGVLWPWLSGPKRAQFARVFLAAHSAKASVGAKKSHCKHGHQLSGDNVALSPAGHRVCITCRRENRRRSRANAKQRRLVLTN